MAMDKNGKPLPPGITIRPDGRYMGRFTYAGERYTLYDNDNPKRLKKAMEDMRYELEHGLKGRCDNIVLNKWVEIWLTEYKKNTVKESTFFLYKRYYGWYIQPEIGKMKVKDIRAVHIQKLINKMSEKNFALNTMKKTYSIILDILNYAMDNDIIIKNPCAGVMLPKKERSERRVMDYREQSVFEEAIKNTSYELIYKVALSTGMRIGEILGLTWDDVDFKAAKIIVRKTLIYIQEEKGKEGILKFQEPKTQSGKREIPMISGLGRALKKHKLKQNAERIELGNLWKPKDGMETLVFTTQFGAPLYERYLTKNLQIIVKKINQQEEKRAKAERRDAIIFASISPHTLRHTFATRAFESGMKPKTVQEILGHSSLAMTMDLYTHVTEDTKAQEMKKLERQA